MATLLGHSGAVWGVALSADGHLVVRGGLDGTVRLWEASTRACLRTLRPERRYERLDITGLRGITAALSSKLQIDGFVAAVEAGFILALASWVADLVLNRD